MRSLACDAAMPPRGDDASSATLPGREITRRFLACEASSRFDETTLPGLASPVVPLVNYRGEHSRNREIRIFH